MKVQREMDYSKIEILNFSNGMVTHAQWLDTEMELSEKELMEFTETYPDIIHEYNSWLAT